MKIREAIQRDLSREIEEIIKVTQHDETTVYTELTEYVATKTIREQYRKLFKAIAEAPADPTEGVGIWISGFFGSGKSAFAKNLGYVLTNQEVLGHRAAELFKTQLNDPQCAALVDSITSRFPAEVVMFDVQVDKASGGGGTTSISLYMYRALLRTLGYADDLNIAELEQSLEADNRLQEFVTLFETKHREAFEADPAKYAQQLEREQWRWAYRRKTSKKINEASAILHAMDPGTFPAADSWAHTVQPIAVTPGYLVDKTFELMARRRPGKAMAFIVDEVGAYVAQSVEKIEDLRAVVEQFGKESKNRVKKKQALAPVWVVVTSQEKLDEVVQSLDSKRVELARLRDRFKYEVDLAPADIREVATKRVLGKTEDGETALGDLYRQHEGDLNRLLKLERSSRRSEVSAEDFVQCYPYPPHFIDLSIDIMSGIRLQPGAAKHLGGSNRTIIKQAYEMLASERTDLASKNLGRLVTLDLIFELVEGNLSTEKQKDISQIEDRFGLQSWEARVAKALTLLEFVRNLPRTENNIAAVLYDEVGGPSPLGHVKVALEVLINAEFVRRSPDGFKLQTASEKSWSTERHSIDVRPRDRGEIRREVLREIFGEPKLRTYQYKGIRTFRVGLTVDDIKLEDGQIPLRVVCADDSSALTKVMEEAQIKSRQDEYSKDLFWVIALSSEVDEYVAELNRSRRMVSKYDQLRGQGKITPEEDACLSAEKNEAIRLKNHLREKLLAVLVAGSGYFCGRSKDGSALGQTASGVFGGLFEWAVPDLYPKLEMGARSLKGNEAEEVLVTTNLGSLPAVFHGGSSGLELIKKEGDRFVANPGAPTAKEILGYIADQAQFGEKVTGKDLEGRFTGLGYGWEDDLIRLVLAVLLRAGAIEVTFQNRRYRDPQDPMARQPLVKKSSFRTAVFGPRVVIDLKTLATAAEAYEGLTGQEVDIEEGAIAKAFRALAESEHAAFLPALATARAHGLPGVDLLEEMKGTFEGAMAATSDDCVRMLADQGESISRLLQEARTIREALSSANVTIIREARRVFDEVWPLVESRGEGEAELKVRIEEQQNFLNDKKVYKQIGELESTTKEVLSAFEGLYLKAHEERFQAYEKGIDWIRGLPEWEQLVPHDLEPEVRLQRTGDLLGDLKARQCVGLDELEVNRETQCCSNCQSGLKELESDLLAVTQLRMDALKKIQQLAAPEEAKLQRIRVADLWTASLADEEQIEKFVALLKDELLKALATGAMVVLE